MESASWVMCEEDFNQLTSHFPFKYESYSTLKRLNSHMDDALHNLLPSDNLPPLADFNQDYDYDPITPERRKLLQKLISVSQSSVCTYTSE